MGVEAIASRLEAVAILKNTLQTLLARELTVYSQESSLPFGQLCNNARHAVTCLQVQDGYMNKLGSSRSL